MDRLSNYIKNGKKVTFSRLGVIFFLIALVMTVLGSAFAAYLFYRSDFQEFLTSIPPVEIQDAQVQKPLDFTWEKEVDNGAFRLRIDTTKDTSSDTLENGFFLTRQRLYVYFKGEAKEITLPKEKTTVDYHVISKALFRGVLNLVLLFGAILFLLLWMGYFGTYLFSHFALWCIQKQADKEALSRSLLVGWLSIFGLNFFLFLMGRGFSLSTGVLLSSVIAVFCILRVNKEN